MPILAHRHDRCKAFEEGLSPIEIWLVRHGATAWSVEGRHTGSTDLPLLPEGEEQAGALGPRLSGHRFVRVLSSPLRRARETARLAGFEERAEVTELLREWDYGEYEGKTRKEIEAIRPGWEVFRDGCPGGEQASDIERRMHGLLELIGDLDGDLLLFAHGHCLRALAACYLEMPLELGALLRLDAGTVSILGQEHDRRVVLLWNEPA